MINKKTLLLCETAVFNLSISSGSVAGLKVVVDVDELKVSQDKLMAKLQIEKEINKVLQEELKVSQDKFMAEVQVEREKYKVLHEDLEKLRTSYQEVNQRYEVDVLTASQQADYLQCELENQIKSHKEMVSQDKLLMDHLRDEQDALSQKMMEEIRLQWKNVAEKETILKTQLNIQHRLNLEFSTERKAERGEKQGKCDNKQEEPISDALPNPKPREIEVFETTKTTKEALAWNRIHHFLGLRKPQKSAEKVSRAHITFTNCKEIDLFHSRHENSNQSRQMIQSPALLKVSFSLL